MMKYIMSLALLCVMGAGVLFAQNGFPDAVEIIRKVDANMVAKSTIVESRMVIHGRRGSREIASRSHGEGDLRSFTEYLAPEREKGTKMLKLEDRLWIYSPSSDRTIQISGHMLRQSVMGSDMSYEDMMEDRELLEMYAAKVVGEETVDGRKAWVLELNAKVNDVNYQSRKTWVDQERYVPLKEELFAKSGQMLKRVLFTDVQEIDGRWYPKKINYKDMLKSGKGTDMVIEKVEFDPEIPAYIFSKAVLKK